MEPAKLLLLKTDGQADLLKTMPFILPPRLLETALSFKNLADRNNFIAARWMLHEYFCTKSVDFDFNDIAYTASGKPYIDGDYHFSIAHTKGLAGILISSSPVGLDIELLKNIDDIHVFSPVFTAEELANIKDEGLHTFFRLWTSKEAILKLTGYGITNMATVHSIKFENDTTAIFDQQHININSFIYEKTFFVSTAQSKAVDRKNSPRAECYIGKMEDNKILFDPLV